MQLALLAVLAGVMLAGIGAGQAWATISAEVELPGIGAGRVGTAELTGNDLGPYGALALLGLVLLVAVAATRGRGRWVVGVALVALGGALVAGALVGGWRAPEAARERALTGNLAGVSTGTELQVARSPAGPALVAAGGLLLAAAGAEALRRGRRWPALGDAFRAPPDRAQPAAGQDEPPWEGD
jgi:Tryptophan-associated transmembrane protein (Trp_oprn_chp)